jgi:hypothetical protein
VHICPPTNCTRVQYKPKRAGSQYRHRAPRPPQTLPRGPGRGWTTGLTVCCGTLLFRAEQRYHRRAQFAHRNIVKVNGRGLIGRPVFEAKGARRQPHRVFVGRHKQSRNPRPVIAGRASTAFPDGMPYDAHKKATNSGSARIGTPCPARHAASSVLWVGSSARYLTRTVLPTSSLLRMATSLGKLSTRPVYWRPIRSWKVYSTIE